MALEGLNEKVAKKKIHIADVERHGEKIMIPQKMDIKDAIETLRRRMEHEETKVTLVYPFDSFVWDGAYAMSKAMEKRYGWVEGKTQRGFFEDYPPQLIGVEISLGKMVQVPWGEFSVPGIEGVFSSGYHMKNSRYCFQFTATVKRKYEEDVNMLRDDVTAYLRDHSIYKGKAISIRFKDDQGKPMPLPEPKFLDLSKVDATVLIFPDDTQEQIETNLFTPIDRINQVRRLGIPVKRGVLMAGDFGVGKTLSAYVAAQKAEKQKVTFIYCQKPEEFSSVMRFAAQYTPTVVFCEDIDRIAPSTRDAKVDEITNVMDGVDNKNQEIITVLTTNDVGKVNLALIRPGRLDAVIHVRRPDAKAVQALVRQYCGKLVRPGDDLNEVGRVLNDEIPAVVREVCERSKLAALRFIRDDQSLDHIPAAALLNSAKTMKTQLELLANQHRKDPSATQMAIDLFGTHVAKAIFNAATQLKDLGVLANGDTEAEEEAAIKGSIAAA